MRGALWRCRCDCGAEKVLSTARLKRTKSCGCLQRRYQASEKPGYRTRHGQSNSTSQRASQLYEAWNRARCSREGTSDVWRDFSTFEQDMGPRPDSRVLMREDPTQSFSSENCFWATRAQVAANLKTAVRMTWDGHTRTISEWAQQTGLSKGIIRKRLARGWSVEAILTRSPGSFKRLDLKGERYGRLVVLEYAGKNVHSQTMWRCRCDCGEQVVVGVSTLRSGHTRSCGCLRCGPKPSKRKPISGTFICSKCKQRRPLQELLSNTNRRCRPCGLPKQTPFDSRSLARRLCQRASQRARKQGIGYSLDPLALNIPERCPVLGVQMTLQNRDSTPTLDRMDPTKGYTQDNVSVISWRANSLKKNGTLEEFENLVQWMRSRQNGDTG